MFVYIFILFKTCFLIVYGLEMQHSIVWFLIAFFHVWLGKIQIWSFEMQVRVQLTDCKVQKKILALYNKKFFIQSINFM